ncbi:CALM1 [Branchiostoma lanceolatum]|uniref:CALM1 protein n=2 Tax=Branchiostoma lanceolatum TaxID=7740 RepID=A0A8K0A297_BRALA|nr:CALM1 [Branchiostoma lanceolatum]CAH1277253.1 CALM1 [Branchiostoma lanceolatum]
MSSRFSRFFDKNGDGKMDSCEMEAALKELDLNPSAKFVETAKRKADANGDGKVTEVEFTNIVGVFQEINNLRSIFWENDQDASGTMSFAEMRKKATTFYTTHADKYGDGKAMEVMNHYAGDTDKEMTMDEFLEIMFADRF